MAETARIEVAPRENQLKQKTIDDVGF